MHILQLFPHWSNKNQMFEVINKQQSIESADEELKVAVYEKGEKQNSLIRVQIVPIMADFINSIVVESQSIEYKNPIIEYI